MNTPEWLKPASYGAAGGAAALAIVGFAWGGWVTGSGADKLVRDGSQAAVVAALVPICVEQSRVDPQADSVLASLEAESTFRRRDALMDTGWATMPGSDEPDRNVAAACMTQLAQQFAN